MKKILFIILCLTISLAGCSRQPKEYGVFIGIDSEEIHKLDRYSIVIIEPSAFSSEQIGKLRAERKTVYGYLNVGAVEEYRPYYDRFRDLSLGIYENWPDERWIDVTSPLWQSFVIDELGKDYAAMGLDGFFLDNADVYYHFPEDDVFQGLCTIMKGLKSYGLPLIINGGDPFVSRCMEENTALSLFDGTNQETVFTKIDFTNQTYGQQAEEETEYFQEYLSKAKEHGLSVYLLEYRADEILANTSPIEINEKRVYEICFHEYILYQIRNESFCSYDPDEVGRGKYMVLFEKSKLLSSLSDITDAQQLEDRTFYPGKWVHYCINTQRHVIDIISHCPPTVSLSSMDAVKT